MEPRVDVMTVELVGGYGLRLTFADGIVGDADFVTREWRGVQVVERRERVRVA